MTVCAPGKGIHFTLETAPLPLAPFSADLRLGKLFARDDYELRAMACTVVARDLADLMGSRGHPWGDRAAVAAAQSMGLQLGEDQIPDDEVKGGDEIG